MTQRANILQELNELGSTLANASLQNVYTVPSGYFESFAGQVMSKIKSSDSMNEISDQNSVLNSIPNVSPYSVPAGYFNDLEEKLMQAVRESADYMTAGEELQSISPMLAALKKESAYRVPSGYFENLGAGVSKNQKIKIVSLTNRRWFRYAAAATITGLVAMVVILFSNQKSATAVDENKAWAKVEKNIQILTDKEILEFVELGDGVLNGNETAGMEPVRKEELREMLKDVSDVVLKDFLNQASGSVDDNLFLN
jgi:hypothetical protein